MPESWMSSPEAPATGQKRSAAAAGNAPSNNFRTVKRRASKACQCCRARKVRCNVVEHGAPCTNCRLDEVECIITESKRRKKFWGAKIDASKDATAANTTTPTTTTIAEKAVSPTTVTDIRRDSIAIPATIAASPEVPNSDGDHHPERGHHVPHFIYQQTQSHLGEDMEELRRPSYAASNASLPSLTYSASAPASTVSSYPHIVPHRSRAFALPPFIKPSSTRIPVEDLEFLAKKGALKIPEESLRNELLKAHFKFVHPFMPLLDRKEFMEIVTGHETQKKIGLLLFQAVMFAGSAFVDMHLLRSAGYTSRKEARKAFFYKARLLYDFDHEPDRMSLVQALLLMTYWYETPDDQKDTWHWMGVAISLSHTIGLHRDPQASVALDSKRKKLWKRIWWSCVMRDRLVALGMRRPTRIKSEDCDVPMLTLDDFDIDMDVGNIPLLCEGEDYEQALNKQRELAIMCIEKAKLCVCISHVLTAQYSVLNTNQGSLAADGSTKTTMVLLPKGRDKDTCEVEKCDADLQNWITGLPGEAVYRPVRIGDEPVDASVSLHRNLLHMVYYTTVSALHRPQVLPSAPAPWPSRNANAALQEISRRKVRQAASEITRLATELIDNNLVRFLPTTGVTVMLPAIIIHLLDIKSANMHTRERSIEGFSVCMQIMQGLRSCYASADYATHFLEAAIKKADIHVANNRRWRQPEQQQQQQRSSPANVRMSPKIARRKPSKAATIPTANDAVPAKTLTPPPDHIAVAEDGTMQVDNSNVSQTITSSAALDGSLFPATMTNMVPGGGNGVSMSHAGEQQPQGHNVLGAATLGSNMDEETTLALKLESFLATTPPPPSSTASAEDNMDREMVDAASPDMLFSATTPPPASITIPGGDDDYYNNHNHNHNHNQGHAHTHGHGHTHSHAGNSTHTHDHAQHPHSPNSNMDVMLGKGMDPFLGHYEDGAELSLRGGPGSGAKFAYSSSWGGFGSDDFMAGYNGAAMGMFGNGGWMEGGVDMESVGKLLDGVDFELEDVIQVLENEIN